MIQLYDYQQDAVRGLRASIRRALDAKAERIAPLLVSPTGSGKTVMFSYLTSRLVAAGKRVFLLAHRDELLEQISGTLASFDVPHGVIGKARYCDPRTLAHVGNVFTLINRLDILPVPDYVIGDEAHHFTEASTWGKVIAYWRARNPALVVIGVTATPERLDGVGLGDVFTDLVLGPTPAQLIEMGKLSRYKLFLPRPDEMPDLSGVRKRGGEYAREEATGRTDKPGITGSAVAQYRKYCDGAPAIVFCGSREHAEHVAEKFRAEGYRAASIDGQTKDRKERVADFKSNVIQVLTSCDLVSEGFDVPGIVAGILLRPTQSLSLYLQQVGRCLRTAPGKHMAYILDHVGNAMMPVPGGGYALNHGFPDDEREWTLQGCKRSKRETDPDDVAVKQCPACKTYARGLQSRCRGTLPNGAACTYTWTVKARKIIERDGELEEADMDALRAQAREAQAAARTAEDLAKLVGEGRAAHILQARAEKAALRQRLLDLSWELQRRTGEGRMTRDAVWALKPKGLREAIAQVEFAIEAAQAAEDGGMETVANL